MKKPIHYTDTQIYRLCIDLSNFLVWLADTMRKQLYPIYGNSLLDNMNQMQINFAKSYVLTDINSKLKLAQLSNENLLNISLILTNYFHINGINCNNKRQIEVCRMVGTLQEQIKNWIRTLENKAQGQI